jgi:hypothetical protein
MERRDFLSLLSVPAFAGLIDQQAPARPGSPDVLLWWQYSLKTGTQPRRLADFLQNAALPALNRAGVSPVGVFEVTFGLPTPTVFLLAPFSTAAALFSIEATLDRDEQSATAGSAYLNATAADPAFVRQDVSILAAVAQAPRIQVPAATAAKGPRLFELRTYESPSERAHRAKVRMFTEMGELEIFRKAGLTPVFFSRTVAGPRMPSLVYMLVHENMAAREKSWDNFRNDPDWKKLAATPGYTDAEIVSNITTVFLRPSAYSQI